MSVSIVCAGLICHYVAVACASQGAPTSKGCGLVIMRSYGDAAAVIAGLEHYKWEGMHSAMVVKLMAPQRQRQDQALGLETAASGAHACVGRALGSPAMLPCVPLVNACRVPAQHCGAARLALQSHAVGNYDCVLCVCCAGASSGGLRSPSHASSSRLVPSASPASRGASSYASPGQMRMVVGGMDMAPPGCAPDAYKLFVGNIPRAYTEPDLLPVSKSAFGAPALILVLHSSCASVTCACADKQGTNLT